MEYFETDRLGFHLGTHCLVPEYATAASCIFIAWLASGEHLPLRFPTQLLMNTIEFCTAKFHPLLPFEFTHAPVLAPSYIDRFSGTMDLASETRK